MAPGQTFQPSPIWTSAQTSWNSSSRAHSTIHCCRPDKGVPYSSTVLLSCYYNYDLLFDHYAIVTINCLENPWTCDARLDWFRSWLRQNMDMTIDTSNSRAVCLKPNWLNNWPIRQPDPPRTSTDFPIPTNQPVVRGASASDLWWIILGGSGQLQLLIS